MISLGGKSAKNEYKKQKTIFFFLLAAISSTNLLFLKSAYAAQLSRMAEDNVKNFPL